jgi:hypothetical protein
MSVVDVLDDPAYAGLVNINAIVTIDAAILTQRRRFPIHLVGNDLISTESSERSPT